MRQPPKSSKTQDDYSHHTSPPTGRPQNIPGKIPVKNTRVVSGVTGSGKFDMPEPLLKHPNPVGRPKNRNEG